MAARRPPSSRRRQRSLVVLVISAVAVVIALHTRDVHSGMAAALADVSRVVRPNSTSVNVGPLTLDGVFKDSEHWRLAVTERGREKPMAVFSNLDGGNITDFSVNYDSRLSKLDMPSGVKHLAVTAVGSDAHSTSLDWTVDAEGDNGRHLSLTSEHGTVVYDASAGAEVQPAKGLTLRYAVDVKRRAPEPPKAAETRPWRFLDLFFSPPAPPPPPPPQHIFNPVTGDYDLEALKPDWYRQGLGLRYESDKGNVRLGVFQPEGGSSKVPDFDAEYSVTHPGFLTSPSMAVKASLKQGKASYLANVATTSQIKGLGGSVSVGVTDGSPHVSGTGDLALDREILPGVSVSAKTQLALKPVAEGKVPPLKGESGDQFAALRPVTLGAQANLEKLVPDFADVGSQAEAHVEYEAGATRPSGMGASLILNSKPIGPMKVKANCKVDGKGQVSGTVSAAGQVGDCSLRYAGTTEGRRQVAEVKYSPPQSLREAVAEIGKLISPESQFDVKALENVGTTAFARVTQSLDDRGGKPRLQLGLQYDINKGRATGESLLYDQGRNDGGLLNEDGELIASLEHDIARRRAEAMRTQVEARGRGLGEVWLLN